MPFARRTLPYGKGAGESASRQAKGHPLEQERDPASTFFASPTVQLILITAAFGVVILFMFQFQRVISQAVLAYVIALAFTPLLAWLRRRMPTWLALTIIMAIVLVAVGGFLVLTVVTLRNAGNDLAQLQGQYTDQLNSIVNWLKSKGVDTGSASSAISGQNVFALVRRILGWVASGLSFSFLLFFIFIYVLVDSMHMPQRLRRHLSPASYERVLLYQSDVRRYWIIQTITGLIAAAGDVALLLVLGVPFAFFLGVLSFITNYIPNIGYFIALLPAMLFAFTVKGVPGVVIVFFGYWFFNTIAGSIVAPRLNAERLSIGYTTSMVGVLFWGAVLGPVGGLVALPLILFVREIVLGDRSENQWLVDLLSHGEDEPKKTRKKRGAAAGEGEPQGA
jgi:AI-2 transport protein TqsA